MDDTVYMNTTRKTVEQVSKAGWYEHTDGSVGLYRWVDVPGSSKQADWAGRD